MEEERALTDDYYMMWLTQIEGISAKKALYLLSHFGTPKEIWNSPKELILSLKGISASTADIIENAKDADALDEKICSLEEKGINYISLINPDYPELLKNIYDPPLGLYYRGVLPKSFEKCFSIIGSRRCSEYGAQVAEKFAYELSENGFIIVSGMAKGIDSMAHRGALKSGGETIAVLGCGVDICYPAENERLMDAIAENGCIISEYPPGTRPNNYNFPQRNRIIAGLSSGLLVVEAGKRSGTLITVDRALDYGRTVFAVPANITSSLSEGTNQLIKEGCPPVTCVDDILFELGVIKSENEIKTSEKADTNLKDDEKEVLSAIKYEPVSLDNLINTLDKPIQNIQYILTYLEIYGYVKKLPGQRYVRSY